MKKIATIGLAAALILVLGIPAFAHDYVDLSDGRVMVAREFSPRVEVYVGSGATIHTKLFQGKAYYGVATREDDVESDIVFAQYKDIDHVLTFKVVGLNSTMDYVTLSTDYANYYVYDQDMSYLGRGDEQLAFSQKYYLANRSLEMEEDYDNDRK